MGGFVETAGTRFSSKHDGYGVCWFAFACPVDGADPASFCGLFLA